MRAVRLFFFVIFAGVVCAAAGQTTAGLHILYPANGDQIDNEYVTVRYELAPEVSAAEPPNFRLLLDDEDPVDTDDSEYTFGLAPGVHTVVVLAVDANGTPIIGAQDNVQFTVVPPHSEPQRPGVRERAEPWPKIRSNSLP